jgi:hypothetical protein
MWCHPVYIQRFNQLFSLLMAWSKLQKFEIKWWQEGWYMSNYLFPTKRKCNPSKQSPFMFNIFLYSWEVTHAINRQASPHIHNRLPCCSQNIFSRVKQLPSQRFLHLWKKILKLRAYSGCSRAYHHTKQSFNTGGHMGAIQLCMCGKIQPSPMCRWRCTNLWS